jgi:hypothetical protein
MQEGTKQQLPSACSGSGSASEAAVERALPAGHHPGPSRSPPGMGIFCHCDPVWRGAVLPYCVSGQCRRVAWSAQSSRSNENAAKSQTNMGSKQEWIRYRFFLTKQHGQGTSHQDLTFHPANFTQTWILMHYIQIWS